MRNCWRYSYPIYRARLLAASRRLSGDRLTISSNPSAHEPSIYPESMADARANGIVSYVEALDLARENVGEIKFEQLTDTRV